MKNYSKAENYYNKGLELATNSGDLKGQAIINTEFGVMLNESGRKQEAIQRLTKSRNLFIQLGDKTTANKIDRQIIDMKRFKPQNNGL